MLYYHNKGWHLHKRYVDLAVATCSKATGSYISLFVKKQYLSSVGPVEHVYLALWSTESTAKWSIKFWTTGTVIFILGNYVT